MSPSTLQSLLVFAGLLACGVFIGAFRYALREACCDRLTPCEPDLPRARLHGARVISGNRWHRGSTRELGVQLVRCVQAALVAFGITSVFVMFLCMAGVVASVLVSSW